ncbi:MAG: thiosulfate oxidation carrier complex protein SoxZ [Armatimonadota bacterium]|nr:thiosulfate oxidation carrier complex protein SoxZ [Armatimonadota bacterium]MDR5702294.1 thiosulfate oxidation carrier complex protein SoxZ [Armatimonadota bacterium]MDR7436036.1 thiosulfate oxidation carrier complex protein SoxZ [Armatimonadota bacterium]
MAEEYQFGQPKLRLPSTIQKGEVIEVKVKIKHPSRTGLRLVEDAKTPFERFVRERPAIYIKTVEVFYGAERISLFELNSSTSDDPLLAFKVRADREAPLKVVFTNNQGKRFEVTEQVRFRT